MESARPPLEALERPPSQVHSYSPKSEEGCGESPQVEDQPQPVSQAELNAWRRGFTPQAEIWNGRLAMVGLSVGLTVLIVARLAHHG
jgi:hypothetical protein